MSDAAWGLKSPGELCSHQWGQAHFVFDPSSGQTHFLNELGAAILDHLSDSVLSAEGLYGQILKSYDIEADPILLDSIRATLLQLDELGLIERS